MVVDLLYGVWLLTFVGCDGGTTGLGTGGDWASGIGSVIDNDSVDICVAVGVFARLPECFFVTLAALMFGFGRSPICCLTGLKGFVDVVVFEEPNVDFGTLAAAFTGLVCCFATAMFVLIVSTIAFEDLLPAPIIFSGFNTFVTFAGPAGRPPPPFTFFDPTGKGVSWNHIIASIRHRTCTMSNPVRSQYLCCKIAEAGKLSWKYVGMQQCRILHQTIREQKLNDLHSCKFTLTSEGNPISFSMKTFSSFWHINTISCKQHTFDIICPVFGSTWKYLSTFSQNWIYLYLSTPAVESTYTCT